MSSTPPGGATAPRRPTAADVELLSAAQQFELAARDLYDTALQAADGEAEPGGAFEVFLTVRENHEEYASALSALIGVDAPHRRDDATFDSLEGGFDNADAVAVATTAYELESSAVATHIDLVGQLEGTDAVGVLASMLLVESQHCTVLADLAGNGDDLGALLDNPAVDAPAVDTAS